ncbi:MAG: helix-turn-helix domain-containing protein, partial [Lachnospiraceae bacterium]|nr:helix-turn-helix domain-containing protein [Lachnospiraceae bacterium]
VLNLRAGEKGLDRAVSWIYFADTLQCLQKEFKMDNYIHGGEFVVLTNPTVTANTEVLISLVKRMYDDGIAALGINEGQILEELKEYCSSVSLPLFELPEKFPLVDLSQILCRELIREENSQNSAEHLFSSILDAEHLERTVVMEQAKFLNIDLEGRFEVAEFAFRADPEEELSLSSLEMAKAIMVMIEREFSEAFSGKLLLLPQTGSVLALIPSDRIKKDDQREMLKKLADKVKKRYKISLDIGIGNPCGYLEDVNISRREASDAIRIARIYGCRNCINFYNDQGIYSLISQISNDKFLDDFIEKEIGKLIEADKVQDGNLCETLEAYLDNNCNASETAEKLFIHRNTLHYRLNKIKNITGKSLESLDLCLMLKLAFAMKRFRGSHNKH